MKLYKYLNPDRVDVLADLHVRFTQPADLHDPFELEPHISALFPPDEEEAFLAECEADVAPGAFERNLKEVLAKDGLTIADVDQDLASRGVRLKAKELITDAEMAEMVRDAVREYMDYAFDELGEAFGQVVEAELAKFGILTLSNTPSSLLMWAHYAESHRGYLIELDSKHNFFHDSRSMGAVGRLLRVRYLDERPPVSVRELSTMHPALWSNVVRDVLLTKGVQWEYEGEYRMVFPLDDQDYYPHPIVADRYHLFPLPTAAITEVIFGARATSLTKDAVTKAVTGNSQLNHVKLGQAHISETRFEVTIEHLEKP